MAERPNSDVFGFADGVVVDCDELSFDSSEAEFGAVGFEGARLDPNVFFFFLFVTDNGLNLRGFGLGAVGSVASGACATTDAGLDKLSGWDVYGAEETTASATLGA